MEIRIQKGRPKTLMFNGYEEVGFLYSGTDLKKHYQSS